MRLPETTARIRSLKDLSRRYGGRAVAFLASFAASKAVVFTAPLILAALFPATSYGAIEVGMSSAQLVAVPLSLGVSSAVPQLILLRNRIPVLDLLALEVFCGSLVCLAAAIAAAALGYQLAGLGLAMTGAALAQGVLASLFRTTSQRNIAVWTDGLATLLVLAVGLVLVALHQTGVQALYVGHFTVGVLLMLAAGAGLMRFREPDLAARARRAVGLGLPLLSYSLVGIWIAASGRLMIGYARGVGDVATYAWTFRVASVVMVLHVLLSVALFARIYRMRLRPFERFASLYTIVFAGLCLGVAIVGFRLIGYLPARMLPSTDLAAVRAISPAICTLMFSWGMQAMLESRINRYRLAGRASRVALLVALVTGLTFYFASTQGYGLTTLAWIVAFQSVGLVLGQLWVLARRRIVLPRLTGVILASFAALIAAQALV